MQTSWFCCGGAGKPWWQPGVRTESGWAESGISLESSPHCHLQASQVHAVSSFPPRETPSILPLAELSSLGVRQATTALECICFVHLSGTWLLGSSLSRARVCHSVVEQGAGHALSRRAHCGTQPLCPAWHGTGVGVVAPVIQLVSLTVPGAVPVCFLGQLGPSVFSGCCSIGAWPGPCASSSSHLPAFVSGRDTCLAPLREHFEMVWGVGQPGKDKRI